MFLATTGATEFWDGNDEVLALGVGCLRYDRRDVLNSRKCSILPNPWTDQTAVEDAARYCASIISRLVPELAGRLNELHGTHFSDRYWTILLGGWLLYYVHTLYDRYVGLERGLIARSDIHTVTVSATSYTTPRDTADFIRLAYETEADIFNLQLYSQVLKVQGAGLVIRREIDLEPRMSRAVSPTLRQRAVYTVLRALVHATRPRVMFGGLGFGRTELLRFILAMLGHGRALPVMSSVCRDPMAVDDAARKRFADIEPWDDFSAVLITTLPTNVPTIVVEEYQSFRRQCLRAWPVQPAVAVASAAWYASEPFKFLAAEFSERGTRLIGMQHGGGYGMSRLLPQEDFELGITDSWLSFGWNAPERGDKVRPLPHPRLRRISTSRRPVAGRGSLLYVATSHPRYVFRFESQPVGAFDEVLAWRERFVRSLPAAVRGRLWLKLHPEDYGWSQRQRLDEACGRLTYQHISRLLRRVLPESRLTVVEYYGTAFLEALAADVPTILFWDPAAWPVREAARDYFEGLRSAEILFDSPEAAATHTARVFDDPDPWWSSRIVQDARRRFVDRFALDHDDWLSAWVAALGSDS